MTPPTRPLRRSAAVMGHKDTNPPTEKQGLLVQCSKLKVVPNFFTNFTGGYKILQGVSVEFEKTS
jgi:hypothetical protein